VILFSCLCLFVELISAQAPQKLSYQAIIRDNANNLVKNAPVGMRLSLMFGAPGGTSVFVETHQTTTNINGLVSISIGSGTPVSGAIAGIDWAAGQYFIKTETDPTGGINYTVVGNSQLLSVPYALYANTAGSSAVGPQGPQGIPGPQGPPGVAGPQGPPGLVEGGNAPGDILYWNGSVWVKLPLGKQNQVLTVCDGALTYTTGGICPGFVGGLDCAGSINPDTLEVGVNAGGALVRVDYSGGNGGAYQAQSVASFEVEGLKATLAAGILNEGGGTLFYTVSGFPGGSGTARFELNLGGKSCLLAIPVVEGKCNAKLSATQTLTFMCHNLGVANDSANPWVPGWEINGGYWQWGYKVQAAPGPVGTTFLEANSGVIAGWNNSPATNDAWSDTLKTGADPCPEGFRLPTAAQWDAIIGNNTAQYVGSWSSGPTNYGSGLKLGNNLFLPAAGYRGEVDGSLTLRGRYGAYWCSTPAATDEGYQLNFLNDFLSTDFYPRTEGLSVRCVVE
jgi:uncharacterized protein (TIGR02145 family)